MEDRIEKILSDLTLDEQAVLTSGIDNWRVDGIPRHDVGRIKMTDGPTGARGDLASGATAVNFPVGSALGASWDIELIAEVATVLADEARSKGAHVLLGPTVNLHRHPLAGRNFECYSEDPELTAQLAIAFIGALQSEGIAACLKHYVCNDSEFERHTISSEVDERTLREVYLRPFEATVAAVNPWSIMGAYNRINGTYACEHDRLVNEVLKTEWGWDGALVSDWYATHDTERSAFGGLDVQMPGPPAQLGPHLAAAVRDGRVPEDVVADKARRMLRLAARTGRFDDASEPEEQSIDTPERRELARRAAAGGMVLLANDGMLPLDPAALTSVALIGPNASPGQSQGGGSSQVTPHRVVSPVEGLRERLGDRVVYERGVGLGLLTTPIDPGLLGGGFAVELYDNPDFEGDPFRTDSSPDARFSFFGASLPRLGQGHFSGRWRARFTPDQSGDWRFGLAAAGQARVLLDGDVVVDDWDDEGPTFLIFSGGLEETSRSVEVEAGRVYDLVIELRAGKRGVLPHLRFGAVPPDPDAEIERAVAAARAADAAIVVIGTSADFESEGEDRASFELPGRQDELVSAIAAVQPNTVVVVNVGSPAPLPWVDDVRAVLWSWYPGQEFGAALADVLLGDVDPGGRLPTTFPHRLEDTPAYTTYPGEAGTVRYGEGVFIGHRWYDARDIEPQFCFGHGLSYTSFSHDELEVTGTDPVTVSVTVANTGDRAGSEVVQVYVGDLVASVPRPPRELKAFTKVVLQPGEQRRVTLPLERRAFAFYDAAEADWKVEPGEFEISVGASSRDLRQSTTISVE